MNAKTQLSAIQNTTTNPPKPTTQEPTAEALQVRRFLAECTVRDLDDTDVLPVADLYGMYIIWCEQTDTKHLPVQVFSILLQAEGLESGISRREKVFRGLIATGSIPIQYILETDKGPGPNSPLESFPA